MGKLNEALFRLRLCLCKQTNTCMTVFVSLRKCKSEIGVKLVFFTFFINSFVETLFKNINYCPPDCTFGPFTYVHCENYMSGFCAFVLNLSKSGNILFKLMSNGNFMFNCHQLSLVPRR